jgi:uncharacterized membrane protein
VWIVLHWLTALAEVIAVVAAILVLGLLIAVAGFWTISRILGRFEDAPLEPDPYDDEIDYDLKTPEIPADRRG